MMTRLYRGYEIYTKIARGSSFKTFVVFDNSQNVIANKKKLRDAKSHIDNIIEQKFR